MMSISLPGGTITMHIAPLQHDFNAIKSEAFKKILKIMHIPV